MAWWKRGLAAPGKGAVLVCDQHLHACWSRYGPRRVLGYEGFPGVQTGNEKSWGLSEMLPFICSGGKLLLSLSASLNATGLQNHARKKKKRRVVLLSGEVWLLLFHCLFVFLLSFDCFVFSLFQTAGSASFIRLIDDGQCGYMENRICLNSRILLRLLILMR